MGKVLFYRDFQGFTGGHLKVWNYFNHTLASPNYLPYIHFTINSLWDETNPWLQFPQYIVQDLSSFSSNILFLAGLDWLRLPKFPPRSQPIINLIQGFRHGDPEDKCYGFLQYPAIRICVSPEIQAAIEATGKVRGKTLVIPNGIDLEKFANCSPVDRPHFLTIVATKQPQMGQQLAAQLQEIYPQFQLQVLTHRLPRSGFIQQPSSSQVTIFLPLDQEGFYLPALEGMAAGTIVICPDCVGNRSFCLDGWNCWRPEYKLESIIQAFDRVLQTSELGRQQIQRNTKLTVAKHDLMAERRTFLEILATVEQLWQEV